MPRLSARVGNLDLRKSNELSQIRFATRAHAAAVHASVPDLDVCTAEVVGCAHVKEWVSELDALELRACRKIKIIGVWRKRPPSHSQSSCMAGGQHATLLAFVMVAFEVTLTKPPAHSKHVPVHPPCAD